jgi:nicotinamidase-related amidase
MSWEPYLTDQDRDVIDRAGYRGHGRPGDHPALVIVDVTYAFCGDRPEPIVDSIERYPNSSGAAAWDAIAVISELIAAARRSGRPIVYTRGLGPSARLGNGSWSDTKNRRHGDDRDSHHEIIPDIAPTADDIVIQKAKPSAFFGTPLAASFVDLGVDSVVVCGGTTSGCVRATTVDAFSYNYPVQVVRDATFDRVTASHWIALLDMDMKYADVVDGTEAVATLAGDRGAVRAG